MTDTIRVKKPPILQKIPTDESSVVQASAGTGKTYALEHLIVELVLENEIAISNILVVTFTERATAELVERVRAILQRLVDETEGDAIDPGEAHWEIGEAERRRLREALFSFDRAPIYTIHGFCHRVLVEHAFANRRPFDQELVEFDDLFDEAFSRAMRRDFTTGRARSTLLQAQLRDGTVDDLRDKLSEAIRTADRVEPVADVAAFEARLDDFEEAVVASRSVLDEMWNVLESVDADGKLNGTKRGKVWRQLRGIRSAYRAYDEGGLADFLSTLRGECDADAPFDYLDDDRIINSSHPEEFRDDWSAALQRLAALEFEPLPLIFDEFLPILRRRLVELKSERGVFTYDDMLAYVRDAVCGTEEQPRDEDLVRTLREEYRFALVDEFQDTDPVQWEIFRELFFESGGSNPCVLIGDPKQAIYGFRGADVRTYFRARDEVREAGERNDVVEMPDNYRSTPQLVAAYNRILEPEADSPFFRPPNEYSQRVGAGLDEKRLVDASGRDAVPIVVTQITAPGDDSFSAAGYRGGLARAWAAEIERLIADGDGEPPLALRENGGRDDDGEEPHGIQPRDIFVLTRTRSDGDRFAAYLREAGIPYAFYKREGLFRSPQARDWYEMLRAVERPSDRSRRLKAWTTPFFGLDLADAADIDEVVDENRELVARLTRWNELAREGHVGQLLYRMLDRTGVLRREVYEHHGERGLTNYEHLAETFVDWAQTDALAFDEIVTRLGRYVEGDAEPEGREGDLQRLETEQQAVQIMTMHKAKGLSAPVVFLYGGYEHNDRPPYRFYDDQQRVYYFGGKDEHARAIESYKQEEDERLLYVAMTRPEGRLYLPYATPEDHGGSLKRSKSPMGPLNERLDDLLEGGAPEGFRVDRRRAESRPPGSGVGAAGAGVPDREALERAVERAAQPVDAEPDVAFGELRAHRRLFVESYSSVDRWERSDRRAATSDEALELDERTDAAGDETVGETEPEGPPPGRTTGLCVHALLEDLDLADADRAEDFEAWRGDDRVAEVFDGLLSHYGMAERREEFEELVWRAATAPIRAPGLEIPSVAAVDRRTPELEFWYPIPGETGSTLRELLEAKTRGAGPRPNDDGYLRGFVDLVFEWEGRVYAADWKSNWLEGEQGYGPAAIASVVDERYEIQALIYATAAARLIARAVDDAAEFEERFGGILYLFARGMGEADDGGPSPGVYFERPDLEELCRWERRVGALVGSKLEDQRDWIARGGHDRWRA